MSDVYLVGGVRTPLGRFGGTLAAVRPDDLAAVAVAEAVSRSGVPGDAVDEVILGCANQAGEDNRNVARMAVLLAGLPETVPGYTVNRLCASGLSAIVSASQAISAGDADVVVAGGVESMTRAPWVTGKPSRAWSRPSEVFDTALGWRFTNPVFVRADAKVAAGSPPDSQKITLSMGETAEEVATLHGITREASDAFALRSHQRAIAAQDAGQFSNEIVAVDSGVGTVGVDEGPRRDTSADKLAALRPVFRTGGIVTAATSSPLSDGAAAVVLASETALARMRLVPRARVVATASAGIQPNLMGLGPVPATQKALKRAGWQVDDLDTVELNEAFAAQSLAVMKSLRLDESIVNTAGGAIALGHPLGCSGARLVVTLLNRLEREQKRRGLATLCVGVGQGVSMLIEAL